MRAVSLAAAGISLVCIALTLAPQPDNVRTYCALGALIGSAVALAAIAAGWRRPEVGAAAPVAPGRASDLRPSPPSAPPLPLRAASTEAEIVAFLATLQDRGRLVDFLQDDIAGYSDSQVGAAARVVHQGCKAALDEYLRVVPLREEREGATVTVPAGYAADEYRLVGRIGGTPPFSGTLMHRGWKVQSVSLPRLVRLEVGRYPAIAPAEVELR